MRIAAAHAVGQQRQATQVREQQVREEKADLLTREDLLAKVDKDVSREVPAAMEPLGQLMAEDETQ